MNNLPTFFNYTEEGPTDNGYETIQDFFLSWTLRCSKDKYKEGNGLLNSYAKRVLYSLLYGNNSKDIEDNIYKVDFDNGFEDFKVIEVKTKRQYKGVDLLVEVEVLLNNKREKYILNIENKWYTNVSDYQLTKNINSISNYKNFNLEEIQLINIVIFCDGAIYGRNVHICRNNNYRFTNIDELKVLAGMYDLGKTGNELFDTYWIDIFNQKEN
ncbi:hypothetical protein E0W68_05495 [Flavobacterium salilacus subsp. salilacus]|uniref:hypothetical protein n=1 Tax=Flavobacterium TaxID=237 RepID=UPI001074D429|nr:MULTISPECIES: hypothetical protein [Flavobacterium]KAF2519227.1 hypothetical protein E0W68_05495 [Flavobacterium salilacus subsp. salilacus]MBE1613407.1 hypothetical protein [Flavobacterium sp. SaA2.13]